MDNVLHSFHFDPLDWCDMSTLKKRKNTSLSYIHFHFLLAQFSGTLNLASFPHYTFLIFISCRELKTQKTLEDKAFTGFIFNLSCNHG